MTPPDSERVESAEIALPGAPLADTVRFFTEELGFRVEAVLPADAPVVVVVAGFGLRLRLDAAHGGEPGAITLRVRGLGPSPVERTAPNGTRIVLIDAEPPLSLPPLRASWVVSRMSSADWALGRAGMQYRDLVPDRQGGRFIASHIRIPDGGPVPDYTHFHHVRFQMIYCFRGWVRVVYEDQGPPFVMRAGDCVLQPPRIRHRVLECSPGLEVIEVGCPAQHETRADHAMALPTARVAADREFAGQRFVYHEAATARWERTRTPGIGRRDTGIGAATRGLAGVHVLRSADAVGEVPWSHDGELSFLVVLKGSVTVVGEARGAEALTVGDACVVPPQSGCVLREIADTAELLHVTLPANP